MADTDLSPMERAVRALGNLRVPYFANNHPEPALGADRALMVIGRLQDLRTSDPDAFAAVLAECGVSSHEMYFHVAEGEAVLGGRVVELEPTSFELCVAENFVINMGDPLQAIACDLGPHEPLYRVKQHTEDAS